MKDEVSQGTESEGGEAKGGDESSEYDEEKFQNL